MKNVLKFSGAIAFVLGLVAFILMMATNSIVSLGDNLSGFYSGTAALFGNGSYKLASGGGSLVLDFSGTLAWNALLGWIFTICGLLLTCFGLILPFLKNKTLDKFAGLLNLIGVALFAVGGVLLFFTVPAFAAANDVNLDKWGLGAGWVIAGILYLVAAGFAALPVVAQILKK